MEEKIECPNCLGHGCQVIWYGEEIKICSGYKICSHKEDDSDCVCPLCEGTGLISWIDVLFFKDNWKRRSKIFSKLRDNITEVENLLRRKYGREDKMS